MRNLQLERIITLSGGPMRWMVRVFAEDKSTARTHQRLALVDETEAGVLRQLATALEHYGSWEAFEAAYTDAVAESRVSS